MNQLKKKEEKEEKKAEKLITEEAEKNVKRSYLDDFKAKMNVSAKYKRKEKIKEKKLEKAKELIAVKVKAELKAKADAEPKPKKGYMPFVLNLNRNAQSNYQAFSFQQPEMRTFSDKLVKNVANHMTAEPEP